MSANPKQVSPVQDETSPKVDDSVTPPTCPVGPRGGATTRSASEAETRNAKKTAKQQPVGATTVHGYAGQPTRKTSPAPVVSSSGCVDGGGPPPIVDITSSSDSMRSSTTTPAPAALSSGCVDHVDGGGPPPPVTPASMGQSTTTNNDMEQDIQERKQLELKLQEKEKLLEARQKELEENKKTINSVTAERDGFKQELEQAVNKNNDMEQDIQERKQLELKLQEKEKLLEARQKELEENKKTINSVTAERDGFRQELEQAVNKIKELGNMVRNDKLVMDKLQTDAKTNNQYMVQLKQTNERDLNHMAERWNQELKDITAKAQLENYNNTKTIDELRVERNELRSRLSKAASDMLTAGGNPDIADLSDPNRAMKLSERFCGIYDDEWTDTFEILTQKHNKEAKEVIQLLLTFLKECLEWCTQAAQGQMDSLKNVVMHPVQSASQDVKAGKVSIGSNELKALTDLRRKISTNSSPEIKMQCLTHLKRQRKRPADVDLMVVANTYCEKCVDLCWLMVLHDPPLHIGLDVKPGTKMDTALYSSYGGSGETIDFLVWPPMYNGTGGGLLAKGTASPVQWKKKGKK